MKTIYILLTRSSSVLSRLIHFATGDDYTHVSIAFDKELHTLYSSGRKNGRTVIPAGPCKESIREGFITTQKNVPCALYKLEVSEKVYEMAKKEVEEIMNNADEYHYNIIGLILCRLNIAYNRKKNFFCSQMVSEVLERSNAVKFKKKTSLIRPTDYMQLQGALLCFAGVLDELIPNLYSI